MKNKLTISLSIIFTIFTLNAHAQETTAWERASNIEKGYSLAGWLEAGWLGDNYPDPDAYTAENMQLFAQLGFKTVRVPVIFEWIIDENPPYNTIIDQAPFDLINSVVIPTADECGLTVILDSHHGRPLTDANFETEIPRLCGQWKLLTQLYADLPHDRYFFELRNEPYELSNANLRTVQQAMIDTIRAYDTERTLIVGANWWSAPWSLVQTIPYNDDNIIYTFHTYDPHNFTHQGLSWTDPPYSQATTFSASDPEADGLRNSLIEVKDWSEIHNVPVFWGEFGASWSADAQSRCNYIEFTTQVADSLDIPWLYWDIKNSHDAFGIFENGVIHQDNLIPCFTDAMGLEYNESCLFTGVENPNVKSPPSVYPNPSISSDVLNIDFDARKTGQAIMEIMNLKGEIVSVKNVNLTKGINRLQHRIGHLPNGNYFIRFRGTGWSSEAQKFTALK